MTRAILLACTPWFVWLIVSFAVLLLLLRMSRTRWDFRQVLRLHADQRGTAQSLSFVLTLPIFIWVLLFIVQVSQLMIGQIVVEYAAFAGARAAAVWIPANLSADNMEEAANRVEGGYVLIGRKSDESTGAVGSVYRISDTGIKFEKIRRAAVLACMAVSPSRDLGESLSGNDAERVMRLTEAYNALTQTTSPATLPRLANKLAYADAKTDVAVDFFHGDGEAPPNAHSPTRPVNLQGVVGEDCSIITYVRDEDGELVPVYTLCFHANEIGWRDPLTVRVTHRLALLPGPGRLMAKYLAQKDAAAGTANFGGSPSTSGNVYDDAYTYRLTASATIGNEGERAW